MSKEIICPHCKKAVAPEGEFYHDDSLNMMCGYCNKVVFPANKQIEDKNKFDLNGGTAGFVHLTRKDCLPIKVNSTTDAIVIPKAEIAEDLSGYYCG